MYLHHLRYRDMPYMVGAMACPRLFARSGKTTLPIPQVALDKNKVSDYTFNKKFYFRNAHALRALFDTILSLGNREKEIDESPDYPPGISRGIFSCKLELSGETGGQ